MIYNKIEDCFDKNGNFIIPDFDPYRVGNDINKQELYKYLFNEDGSANPVSLHYVFDLIVKNNFHFTCDAVKYYYAAKCIDPNCKGNYTASYAWRH